MEYKACKGSDCPYYQGGYISSCSVNPSDKVISLDENPIIFRDKRLKGCDAIKYLEKSIEYHMRMAKHYEAIISRINTIDK